MVDAVGDVVLNGVEETYPAEGRVRRRPKVHHHRHLGMEVRHRLRRRGILSQMSERVCVKEGVVAAVRFDFVVRPG